MSIDLQRHFMRVAHAFNSRKAAEFWKERRGEVTQKKSDKIPRNLYKWLMWLQSQGYETISITEVLQRIPISQRGTPCKE